MERDRHTEFETAMGETFGECVSPPIPFEEADIHECCEVMWSILGADITPTTLSLLTEDQMEGLRQEFGTYFASEAPTMEQIQKAIDH